MTNEDKELLLKDLRGRLPYGFFPTYTFGIFKWKDDEPVWKHIDGTLYDRLYLQLCVYNTDNMSFKPYLRPLSSMTDEEAEKYNDLVNELSEYNCLPVQSASKMIDWLNARRFDYRGLIDKELALVAPEDMYLKQKL